LKSGEDSPEREDESDSSRGSPSISREIGEKRRGEKKEGF